MLSNSRLLRQGQRPITRFLLLGCAALLLSSAAFAATVSYAVKKGDSLSLIGDKFHIGVSELCKANHLTEDSVLQIGQKLTIPGQNSIVTKAGDEATVEYLDYAVVKGDTLGQIAEAHEISLIELLQSNGLTEKSMLKVGLVLRIPVPAADDEADAPDPNPDVVSYALVQGDSLWTVAKKFGMSVQELAAYNRIGTGQVLMPGQVLLLPPAGDALPLDIIDNIDPNAPILDGSDILSLASPVVEEPVTTDADGDVIHVVEQGDTVSHLAVKFRTTRAAIQEANQLGPRDTLQTGAKLVIPSGSLDRDRARVTATRSTAGLPSRGTSEGQKVVKFALSCLGTPYVWAGTNLKRGVDCSGFVMSVYQNFGRSLPHSSKGMASEGKFVRRADLQPGDVICFHTTRSGISHVGM
ncbi:MAG: LysM peptidoglycan-binding domain-containing protein, partial [bacterium]